MILGLIGTAAVGDLNGDDKLDLAVFGYQGSVSIMSGQS